MVNYFELGHFKQLNEIVVAGSHDAGITSGDRNVITQALNIQDQAAAGVRVFDLRIAAATVKGAKGAPKGVELRAFHADSKVMQTNTKVRHLDGGPVTLERTKLWGGAFGIGLTAMLGQARAFVESREGSTEFLILKFDKCLNWPLIAEACVNVLGNRIYKGTGNLNTTRLHDLQGKVVVVFSGSGVAALHGAYTAADGILAFRNLYDKKTGGTAYQSTFPGLQYYGKGGTSVTSPFHKRKQNEKKQGALMQGAKLLGHPDIMGMMYWTSTGIFESIRKRNDKMWSPPNVERLRKLWAQGLEEFVEHRNPLTIPQGSPAIGPTRKRYMPNIVMIDFADNLKCQQIRDLNDLSAHDLAALGSSIS
jgi:hypothetical protein